MGLVQKIYPCVPTPSGILDLHFPSGSTGAANSWANIPAYLNNPVGVHFTVDLKSLYLTDPGGAATISIFSGSLTNGWTLNSSGVLDLSAGSTVPVTLNIAIQAKESGQQTVVSNVFTISSIPPVTGDTLPPTIPTGLQITGHTTTTLNASVDPPADVPAGSIAASGDKQVNFYLGGVLKGSTPISPGLSLSFSKVEFSTSANGRIFVKGHMVDVPQSESGYPSQGFNGGYGGIPWSGSAIGPSPGSIVQATTGPFSPQVNIVMIRHYINELINAAGTAYTYKALIDKELADLAGIQTEVNGTAYARPVYYIILPITRSYQSNPVNIAPAYLGGNPYTYIYQDNGVNAYTMARWNATVTKELGNLYLDIGNTYGNPSSPSYNPNFIGIATQETAPGKVGGGDVPTYSVTDYVTGQNNESTRISAGFPGGRHFWYHNQMPGDGNNQFYRSQIANHVAANGGWMGGPDLLPNNVGLISGTYPLFPTQKGVQPMFNSFQYNELTGAKAAGQTLAQWAEWGIDGNAHQNVINVPSLQNGLDLDMLVWTWKRGGGSFAFPDAITAMAQLAAVYPTGFGSFVNPTVNAIPAGTLVQSGVDYSLTSYGKGIGATADSWSPAQAPLNGSGFIVVKINPPSGANPSAAFGGVCFRETQTSSSRSVNFFLNPSRLSLIFRPQPGVATQIVTYNNNYKNNQAWFLKLSRDVSTNTFNAYISPDGNGWTLFASVVVPMNPSAWAEFYICSDTVTSVTAIFNQVNVQNLAVVPFSFTGLSAGTSYNLSAASEDISSNVSNQGPAIAATPS